MKRIYWLKTDPLRFFPSGEPIPEDAWESIEVTDAEWQRFKDAQDRVMRRLQYAFSHPRPITLPPGPYKFGFAGYKVPHAN